MARALLWVSVVVVAVVLPETTADMVFQFHEADIALAKKGGLSDAVRCVDWRIMADPSSGSGLENYGDGFSRLAVDTPQYVIDDINSMNVDGQTFEIPGKYMAGANVWMLDALGAALNVSFSYSAVQLPDALLKSPNTGDHLKFMWSLGFDCVINTNALTSANARLASFLAPTVPFEYTAITTLPTLPAVPLSQRLWSWTLPFTPRTWGVLSASLMVTGIAMWAVEGPEEGGPSSRARTFRHAVRSMYLGALTFTTQNADGVEARHARPPHPEPSPEPARLSPPPAGRSTWPGRIHKLSLSLCTVLLFACYLANLAAALTTAPVAVQPITSIDSFGPGNPACVLQNTGLLTFLNSNYPSVPLEIVPSVYSADLYNAILSGTYSCIGGIGATTSAAYYFSSMADPNASFCELQTVGPAVGSGFLAIAFNPNSSAVPAAAVKAMSLMALNLVDTGVYYNHITAVDFPPGSVGRPQCDAIVAAATAATATAGVAPALDVMDLAGIFVIEAIGLACACGLRLFLKLEARAARTKLGHSLSAAIGKRIPTLGYSSEGKDGQAEGDPEAPGSAEDSLAELLERSAAAAAAAATAARSSSLRARARAQPDAAGAAGEQRIEEKADHYLVPHHMGRREVTPGHELRVAQMRRDAALAEEHKLQEEEDIVAPPPPATQAQQQARGGGHR